MAKKSKPLPQSTTIVPDGGWVSDPRDLTGRTRIMGPCTVVVTWYHGEALEVEVTR